MTRHRGQSLVEFAFVFPLFLLLVLGLVDVGRAVWHYNTTSYVARDAARQFELGGSVNLARCNAAFTEGCTAVSPAGSQVLVSCVTTANGPAINVAYTFQPIITFILGFPWISQTPTGSGTFTISAQYLVPLAPGACP